MLLAVDWRINRAQSDATLQTCTPACTLLLVTVGEAARRLGLSPATLRRQIANGRLGATKLGRDWDIPSDEVTRYRAESRGRPGRRRLQPTLGLLDS